MAQVFFLVRWLTCEGVKWHFPRSCAWAGVGSLEALVTDPSTPGALLFQSATYVQDIWRSSRYVFLSCMRGSRLQARRKEWPVARCHGSTICSHTGQSRWERSDPWMKSSFVSESAAPQKSLSHWRHEGRLTPTSHVVARTTFESWACHLLGRCKSHCGSGNCF